MAIEKYILETAQLAIGYATHKPVLKDITIHIPKGKLIGCLLYTSPSPRDQRGSRMPSSA